MRVAVIAGTPGAFGRIEAAERRGHELIVLASPEGRSALGRFADRARWTENRFELLAPVPELVEAAATRRALLSVKPPVDEIRCGLAGALGWAIALGVRQGDEFSSARLVVEVEPGDGRLAGPLVLGDTVATALVQEATAQVLRDADAVEGDAEALSALAARGWTLGTPRREPAWPSAAAPQVTVVVTHKNLEQYLPACLASIRAQTVPVELVLVDDGSDQPGLACVDAEAAQNPSMKVIRQANTGVAQARNRGAKEAEGKLVCFVDADNLLRPRFVDSLREALRRRQEAHFAVSGFRAFEDGSDRTIYHYCPAELSARTLFIDNTAGDACAMHRRDTFLEAGGFSVSQPGVEDWDLWLRYAAAGVRGAVVPEALFEYRVRADSMLHSRSRLQTAAAPFMMANAHRSLLSNCGDEVSLLAAAHFHALLENSENRARWSEKLRLELEAIQAQLAEKTDELAKVRELAEVQAERAAGAALRERRATAMLQALEQQLIAERRSKDAIIEDMANSIPVRSARALKSAAPALYRVVGKVVRTLRPPKRGA